MRATTLLKTIQNMRRYSDETHKTVASHIDIATQQRDAKGRMSGLA
jgi:hypothetical protein